MSDPLHRQTIPCPHCGRQNNSHVVAVDPGAGTHLPVDGDWSVCWNCRRPARFVAGPFGMALRALSPDEEAEVAEDVRRLLAAAMATGDPLQAARRLRGQG